MPTATLSFHLERRKADICVPGKQRADTWKWKHNTPLCLYAVVWLLVALFIFPASNNVCGDPVILFISLRSRKTINYNMLSVTELRAVKITRWRRKWNIISANWQDCFWIWLMEQPAAITHTSLLWPLPVALFDLVQNQEILWDNFFNHNARNETDSFQSKEGNEISRNSNQNVSEWKYEKLNNTVYIDLQNLLGAWNSILQPVAPVCQYRAIMNYCGFFHRVRPVRLEFPPI